jgi:hypothetical protein
MAKLPNPSKSLWWIKVTRYDSKNADRKKDLNLYGFKTKTEALEIVNGEI